MLADSTILVDGSKPADIDVVADSDMAAEGRIVRHGDVVADPAIMGDMGTGHEVAVAAHMGRHLVEAGAAVHGDVFADDVPGADLEPAMRTIEPDILRWLPQGGERMDLGRRTEMGAAIDDHMSVETDARLQRRLLPDKAVSTDLDVVGQLGSR